MDTLLRYISEDNQNTAVRYGTYSYTYAELNKESHKYFKIIQDHNIPYSCIGVFMDDKIEYINTTISILKSGNVLVPLYTQYPDERIKAMIGVIDLCYLFIDDENYKRLSLILNLSVLYTMQSRGKSIHFVYIKNEAGKRYIKENGAYIHFTSGTTGNPKAVLGSLDGLKHYINWLVETFKINSNSVVSQLSIPGFDPFLKEVIGTLYGGGTICIPDFADIIRDAELFKKWIDKMGITVIHCVPSLFRQLCESRLSSDDLIQLKCIGLAGEKVNPLDLTKWFEIFGNRIKLYNCYGPTETTMSKLYYEIQEEDVKRGTIPVGKPMDGAEVIIVDDDNKICEPLVVGEILIKTRFGSYGYVNNDEMNMQRFITNPITQKEGDIVYRTGDLGRCQLDGNIDIVGRADRQVKILGFRVELEEIESSLLKIELIKEASVIKKEIKHGQSMLVSFVVLSAFKNHEREGVVSYIREKLNQILPSYMVPSHYIVLDSLPRNERGKIDYNKLQSIPVKSEVTYLQPRTKVEKEIYEIWKELLGIEDFGVDQDFLELGGNSLSIMSLKARITVEFDIEINLGEFFQNRTIKEQALLIENSNSESPNEINSLIPAIPYAPKQNEYDLSLDQQRIWILSKFEGLATYNIPLSANIIGEFDINTANLAIQKIIERHKVLRTRYIEIDGIPKQVIADKNNFRFLYYDFSNLDENEQNEKIKLIMEHTNQTPFNVEDGEIIKGVIFKVQKQKHVLFINIFHIGFDGWSIGILVNEFSIIYEAIQKNKAPELPKLEYQYIDYVYWQKEQLEKGNFIKRRDYWLSQLSQPIQLSNSTYYRVGDIEEAGEMYSFKIDKELTNSIKKLAYTNESSAYMILLSAYFLLLHKISSEKDIVIGVPFSGREKKEFEQLIGFFVNTLPIRVEIGSLVSFKDLINKVRDLCVKAFENNYPFNQLVKELNPTRNTDNTTYFSTVFLFHNTPLKLYMPDIEIELRDYFINKAKFDYRLDMQENGEEFVGRFEYKPGKIQKREIMSMAESFITILNLMVRDSYSDITSIFGNNILNIMGDGFGIDPLE